MAHSNLTFRGVHDFFDDGELLLVLHFMVDQLNADGSSASRALAVKLSRHFDGYTPGCVLVPLDELTRHEEEWRKFCPALRGAHDRIGSYGNTIPRADVERIWAVEGISWYDDTPTKPYVELSRRLGRLCACAW
jgi:hypothetical protein